MRPLTKNLYKELSSIVSCLAYLENESRKLGLEEIASKLSELLRDIDKWVENNSYELTSTVEKITSTELFRTMLAIEKVALLEDIDIDSVNKASETFNLSHKSRKQRSH